MSILRGTKKTREMVYDEVKSFEIEHLKDTKYGVSFTLVLNGVRINGCRVGETRDGVEFIALPQYKGSDGRFYNHVFFRFSQEDTEAILRTVEAQLTEGEG